MEIIMSYCQVVLMAKNEFFISYSKACICKLFTGPVFLDSHLRSAKNAKQFYMSHPNLDFSPSFPITHSCPPASYQMAISTPVAGFVLCPLFWMWPVSALCSLSWFLAALHQLLDALHQLLIHQHPLKALSFFTLSLFILPCFSTSSLPH